MTQTGFELTQPIANKLAIPVNKILISVLLVQTQPSDRFPAK